MDDPAAGPPADPGAVTPADPGAAPGAHPLRAVVVELERHADAGGWDQSPALYALVDTAELLDAEPSLVGQLGVDPESVTAGSITPVEQEPLGDLPLDEALGRIAWPERVLGCALVHEAVALPPGVEEERPDDADPAGWAAEHPRRREIRMVAGVLRDGSSACVLRLRPAAEGAEPEVAYGDDLAPNLVAALLATLE
jgi:hypothetical protein